jgi:putative flippase GtrA
MTPSNRVTAQFTRFVLANTFAAAANIGIKFGSFFLVGDPLSVVLGFLAGLSTSYVLCRSYVFHVIGKPKYGEVARFTGVNLVGLAITFWTYQTVLANLRSLPALSTGPLSLQTIAHSLGVAAPIALSFVAQKTLTFRQRIR